LARCPYIKENGDGGQAWVQRCFLSSNEAQVVGWRQVRQVGPQGPELVWACPECALALGVVAKLVEDGYEAALVILLRHGGIMSTRDFSLERWPDMSTGGKGWNMAATGLLGRLVKLALVECVFARKTKAKRRRLQGYRITRAGQLALQAGRYDVPPKAQKERTVRRAKNRRRFKKRPAGERPRFEMVYA
jgi:hypothetical protein